MFASGNKAAETSKDSDDMITDKAPETSKDSDDMITDKAPETSKDSDDMITDKAPETSKDSDDMITDKAPETSKDSDDMITDRPWNIVRIRLPPRKRLSDGSLILNKKAPRATDETQSRKLTELTMGNPGKNLITAAVQGEASSNSARAGLCNEANGDTLRKMLSSEADSDTSSDELPEEANDSTTSKNLKVTAGDQEYDASRQGLCEEANNNILIMELPRPVKEFTEDHVDKNPSKNLTTTGLNGEEENKNSPKKKLLYDPLKCLELFKQPSNPMSAKEPFDQAKNNALSNEPIYPVNRKKLHTSTVQINCTSHNTPVVKLSTSVGQVIAQCTSAKNLEAMKEYQEFEKAKRTVYLDNLPHHATEAKKNPSWNLTTTAVKFKVLEQARNPIPTNEQFDQAKNNAPNNTKNRSTDPAKKNIPRKNLHSSPVQATVTSETSGITFSIAVGQDVEQSINAADLRAVKWYQEFEDKVKRTVYLDNLSHESTETVIKSALNQFGTLTKVSFVVNYTIPYDIPRSAFVEMETEKDAEVVVNMLHEFPFMISGMPRPVRAKLATAEMFNDRPQRPGSKLEFCWVGPRDPEYEILKQLKFTSRRHEVENLALIEHEQEEEKLLAEKQQEILSCNYRMLETMDTVIMSRMASHLSHVYRVNFGELF